MAFTVTTLADDQTFDGGDLAAETADGGGLTLREALGLANNAADADTIDFTAGLSGGTLTLAQGELAITQSVGIDGDINDDGMADIAIDAHGASRVFNIADALGAVGLNGLTIENGNVAGNGGGILMGFGANLTLSNSVLADNTAGNEGGGLFGDVGSTITLINSTVSGNDAANGGGVYSGYNASLTVVNTTIVGNSALGGDGGGLYCPALSTATLVNATISGNQAADDGGGIYCYAQNIITLINSTVTGNSAGGSGGGLYNFGSDARTTLTNSIVAGNLATDSGNDLYGGASFSNLVFAGPSIIGSAPANFASIDTTNGTPTQIDGTNQAALETVFASVGSDPLTGVLAGVLADNGGVVATVAINPTGIAHDTGSNGNLPADVHDLDGDGNTAEPLPVDARGNGRVVGAGVDLGAYEFNLAPVISSGGGGATAAASIAENGTAIATVLAADLDGPGLIFALAGGADAAQFTINGLTGALAFIGPPDFETPTDQNHDNVYEVIVAVADGAGGVDQQTISVSVTDVNGVAIRGSDVADRIDATHTVAGEPLPTGEEDRIFGFFGNDHILSGDGNDVLIGSRGNDRLSGEDGDDRLAGGFGRNILNGGDGADRFVFNERLGVGEALGFADPLGFSRIAGFSVGEDKIVLARAVFHTLAHVHYDSDSGALSFDPGAPGGDLIQFAALAKNLAITGADFVLV